MISIYAIEDQSASCNQREVVDGNINYIVSSLTVWHAMCIAHFKWRK